ncbi:MAG: PTS transporter subunit IIB [Atopobium sp.]|nr:PTS transporter subunit IIB [Atopobium sp.]
MTGIVVASHGNLSEGLLNTLSMFMPGEKNLEACVLTPDMGPDAFKAKLVAAADKMADPEQVLLLVDLWGGTPFNVASELLAGHPSWALITGVNLPLLMEAVSDRDDKISAHDLAKQLIVVGRSGIKVKPESIMPKRKAAAAGSNYVSSSNKPLELSLVRVDGRLLHGQVATVWSKAVRPTRIVVVSDGVAHNALRKTMITEAAPPGVKATAIPVQKFIDVCKDPRFNGQRFIALFEKPQDVVRAVESGVKVSSVDVGNMPGGEGKTMIGHDLSMDAADVQAFKSLRDKGIEVYSQKVPNDPKEDIFGLIKKAGEIK